MNDIFSRGLELFTGIIYESVNNYSTFTHIRSIFKDEWYNFIVPSISPNLLNWKQVESIINSEKLNGFSLSYYIPDNFLHEYKSYFKVNGKNENLSSDFYICKHINKTIESSDKLVLIDDTTIKVYISMARTCFPEWANNEQYATHMYNHQKDNKNLVIRNYLLKHDDSYVGFCGLIGSQKNNLAYFHNTGVLPDHRRKGYFTSIIQNLINVSASLGISDTYALVEDGSGSYNGLIKMGYTVKDKYHLFST